MLRYGALFTYAIIFPQNLSFPIYYTLLHYQVVLISVPFLLKLQNFCIHALVILKENNLFISFLLCQSSFKTPNLLTNSKNDTTVYV